MVAYVTVLLLFACALSVQNEKYVSVGMYLENTDIFMGLLYTSSAHLNRFAVLG
jgi:hypothetical protein